LEWLIQDAVFPIARSFTWLRGRVADLSDVKSWRERRLATYSKLEIPTPNWF
jgi:hypothetical protein